MSDYYCPFCGNASVESMEEAMVGVWMYHLHYCQKCGCSFKILRKSIKKIVLDKIDNKLDIEKISENLRTFNKVWENDEKVRCPNCDSIDIFPKYVSEDEIVFQCHECINRFSVTNNGKFEIIVKTV